MVELSKLILSGKFDEAYQEIKSLSFEEICRLLKKTFWDSQSITVYGFVTYLLLKNENHEFHSLASDILAFDINFIEGAYPLALYHARKAYSLNPADTEYLQYLLFFHDIPDRLIEKEEALQIAKEVLNRNPESTVAKKVILRYENNN